MIKVNNSTNCVQSNSFLYYVNSAILFTRIFGSYKVGCKTVNYASETMVLGETYLLNLPPGAYGLSVNIETSAYFSWTNCYSAYYGIIQPSLCLYTIGVVFHVSCFDAPCNDRKIESLLSKYLLENPIEYKNRSVYKSCCNKNNNSSLLNSNSNCKNKCDLCISEVTKKYMRQIRNYAKLMKNYLPDDVLFYLNIDR